MTVGKPSVKRKESVDRAGMLHVSRNPPQGPSVLLRRSLMKAPLSLQGPPVPQK